MLQKFPGDVALNKHDKGRIWGPIVRRASPFEVKKTCALILKSKNMLKFEHV